MSRGARLGLLLPSQSDCSLCLSACLDVSGIKVEEQSHSRTFRQACLLAATGNEAGWLLIVGGWLHSGPAEVGQMPGGEGSESSPGWSSSSSKLKFSSRAELRTESLHFLLALRPVLCSAWFASGSNKLCRSLTRATICTPPLSPLPSGVAETWNVRFPVHVAIICSSSPFRLWIGLTNELIQRVALKKCASDYIFNPHRFQCLFFHCNQGVDFFIKDHMSMQIRYSLETLLLRPHWFATLQQGSWATLRDGRMRQQSTGLLLQLRMGSRHTALEADCKESLGRSTVGCQLDAYKMLSQT